MNCLTCEKDFKFYNRSNNCLNCPKYVNFYENECINEIPEGYYLEDKELGSLGKCYYLCKTCTAGSYIDSYKHIHMNCISCLYQNSQFKPIFTGDCPDTPETIDPDSPVDGKCPIEKPILKNGKCQLIYCSNLIYKLINLYYFFLVIRLLAAFLHFCSYSSGFNLKFSCVYESSIV